MNKFLMVFLASIFTLSTLTGCQTMEGFGDDVQDAGDKVEDATD